ncbi:hypothetical protein BC567DRAFT_232784 [Phyllosticta citribraziliensis]
MMAAEASAAAAPMKSATRCIEDLERLRKELHQHIETVEKMHDENEERVKDSIEAYRIGYHNQCEQRIKEFLDHCAERAEHTIALTIEKEKTRLEKEVEDKCAKYRDEHETGEELALLRARNAKLERINDDRAKMHADNITQRFKEMLIKEKEERKAQQATVPQVSPGPQDESDTTDWRAEAEQLKKKLEAAELEISRRSTLEKIATQKLLEIDAKTCINKIPSAMFESLESDYRDLEGLCQELEDEIRTLRKENTQLKEPGSG